MLNRETDGFENSVYPDQLASEKPADLDTHCSPFRLLKRAVIRFMKVKWAECGKECSTLKQLDKISEYDQEIPQSQTADQPTAP